MARPKKLAGKTKTNTKQAKETTPTKTMNGKVVKKRVPLKTIKSGEDNVKAKCNEKQDLQDLKRNTIDIKNNLKSKTLQTQCKPSGKRKHEVLDKDYEIKPNNLIINSKRKATENNTKKLLEKKTDRDSTKANNPLLNTIANKSVFDIKDSKGMQIVFRNNNPKMQINSRNQIQNTLDYPIPVKTKRCFIKLQKIRTTEKGAAVVSTTISTPITIRKCAVKLCKNSTAQYVGKSLNAINKDCVRGIDEFSNTDSLSSNLCYNNLAVIDNNKRQNFSKLSLTKSFNILEDDGKKAPEKSKASTTSNDKTQVPKQAAIKQIEKLSLRRPIGKPDKDKTNKFRDSQIESQFDYSVPFNPARNSTLLELDSTKNTQQKSLDEETKKTSPSKHRYPFQNLANKSDEIEKLLSTLDDEEEVNLKSSLQGKNEISFKTSENKRGKRLDTGNNITNNNSKTNKFFHHKKPNDAISNLEKNPKTAEVAARRRFPERRSTKVQREKIYDFLSQSQTTDPDSVKHVDPTADVVRKLIKQGKVRVATNAKGKGKPKFKQEMCRKNKKKQTTTKKLNPLKNSKQLKKVTFVESRNGNVEEDYFDNDHLDNGEEFVELGHNIEIERQNTSGSSNIHNVRNLANDQEGTFSSLARTVLINQADRSNALRKTQSALLDKVRRIISTPKNKESVLTHTDLQTDLSPITMPPLRANQQASPWRVNEEAYLPKTFNFSRSSLNLPSFSSDYIPSTPRKEMSKKYLSGINQIALRCEKSPIKRILNPSVIVNPNNIGNLSVPSTISSFSSNDSNAENITPLKTTPVIHNENEKIFNSKHLPNPRRSLKNRSPLKAINILEIVHLPPYKQTNKITNFDDLGVKELEMFGFEGNLYESNQKGYSKEALNAQPQNDNYKNIKKQPREDMFGFEEYLSQADVSSQENVEFDANKTSNKQSETMHDKLQSLRKLKPPENETQKSVKQNSKHTAGSIPLFDDEALKNGGMKQRKIKEMLCSTLLDSHPSTSKDALNQLNKNKLKATKRPNFGQDVNLSELFVDPEPETTFNESEAHRTYIRPHKRKRRLRENNFVMLLESDESGEEDNSGERHQHSRESDKSMERVTKKPRQHKVSKDEMALKEFVKEFDELCKEVASYELVVEKSA